MARTISATPSLFGDMPRNETWAGEDRSSRGAALAASSNTSPVIERWTGLSVDGPGGMERRSLLAAYLMFKERTTREKGERISQLARSVIA